MAKVYHAPRVESRNPIAERSALPLAEGVPAYFFGQRRLKNARSRSFWEPAPMHILIIEDEPIIAMSIEFALRGCGCASFDFATSAVEAAVAAKRRCPDLITPDVQLAPGCGIDAVGAICRGRAIPVIFITGTAADIQVRRPGSIIVHKPFDDAHIRDAFRLATGDIDPRLPAAA